MTTPPRLLFILKRREDYSDYPSYSNGYQIATGMYNSAKFVADVLEQDGRRNVKVVIVIDANDIDREVTLFNPSHIFIEGLWVTPAKFAELKAIPRHADRLWHVRIHSEVPFLATEGIAFTWITQYLRGDVIVATNAPRAHQQMQWYAQQLLDYDTANRLTPFLPNCYPVNNFWPLENLNTRDKEVLDIACFGAYRPMKNHLQQLFAAARYGEAEGKHVRFHVNQRFDQGGGPVARNVEAVCDALPNVELVPHEWEDRETFLNSLSQSDMLMQVSMSETFNIVAADATLVGKPIIVSKEIGWAYPAYADPQSVDDIIKNMYLIMSNKTFFINSNRAGLTIYAQSSARRWYNYVGVIP